MASRRNILKFLIFLILSLVLTFFVHSWFLRSMGFEPFESRLIQSYLVNGFLAAVITVCLFFYRAKLKNYIGFLFMGGSFLKFLVFFVLFYPPYRADGDMSRLEFSEFFVPYGICLALETFFIAKMLQNLDY